MPPEIRIMPEFLELARVRIWRFGIPAPIWIEHAKLIKKLVGENKLEPIAKDLLDMADFGGGPMMLEGGREPSPRPIPRPFPGGLRIAHFHMGPDVYKVDPKVWDEFTAGVVESVRARLNRAGSIGVEQLVELSEATAGL